MVFKFSSFLTDFYYVKLNSGQFHLKYEKIKSDITAHCIIYYLYYIYNTIYYWPDKLLPENWEERLIQINKWTISTSLYFIFGGQKF